MRRLRGTPMIGLALLVHVGCYDLRVPTDGIDGFAGASEGYWLGFVDSWFAPAYDSYYYENECCEQTWDAEYEYWVEDEQWTEDDCWYADGVWFCDEWYDEDWYCDDWDDGKEWYYYEDDWYDGDDWQEEEWEDDEWYEDDGWYDEEWDDWP